MICTCMIIAAASFSSCNWDDSPEYDHPTYITYYITAGDNTFTGPEQLLLDFQTWVNANQLIYDVEIKQDNYSERDAEALKKYEGFAAKFREYLTEVEAKLASDKYGANVKVKAQFYITAYRIQGENRTLKTETVDFQYPRPSAE